MRFYRFGFRPASLPGRGSMSRFAWPVFAALAVFLAYPSITSYQDVALLAGEGTIAPQERWLAHIQPAPGSSVLAASMDGTPVAVLDPVNTGSLAGADASYRNRIATNAVRQPQRINRAGKGDRVVTTNFVRPPQNFTAGAVLQRQSMLEPVAPKSPFDLAFSRPLGNEAAIEIATAFMLKKPRVPLPAADLPVIVADLVVESGPNILAYSQEPAVRASPFAAVLKEDEPVNLIPKLDENDHAWAAKSLPVSVFSDREQHCLTAGIYFEARGEPVRGQAAVAQVILNRVKNPAYPSSICGVVYQNKEWRNRCQFSFACDKIKDKVKDPDRWETASYVARETTAGRIWLADVGSSTHYHATYVKPKWARSMEKVGRIGLHIFYRTFGGGWS